jgi:hypothetical protein
MFLVEPAAGRQKIYDSALDLGAAVRRGELGPEARIYHRATDRWLPITMHPEYRKAAADRERHHAMELKARKWTFLSPDAEDDGGAVGPAGSQAAESPVLIPGDPPRSWLGSTMRRLRSLAHR